MSSYVSPQFKYMILRLCICSLLRVYYEFTMLPAPSRLDNSVGRALYRYRRSHGFDSRSGLNFFQALILQLLKLCAWYSILLVLFRFVFYYFMFLSFWYPFVMFFIVIFTVGVISYDFYWLTESRYGCRWLQTVLDNRMFSYQLTILITISHKSESFIWKKTFA